MAAKPNPKPVRNRKAFKSAGNQVPLPMPPEKLVVSRPHREFDEQTGEYYGKEK